MESVFVVSRSATAAAAAAVVAVVAVVVTWYRPAVVRGVAVRQVSEVQGLLTVAQSSTVKPSFRRHVYRDQNAHVGACPSLRGFC